jgi:hypothetical protein
MVELDGDLLLLLKFFRGSGDQFLVVFDYIPDVIGQFSGPIGDELPFFQDGDIGLG